MRAVVVEQFGPPEALRVRETPAPVPGPGEVLVEIHAAPVNYVDMLVVGGVYQFLPTLPVHPRQGPGRHRRGGRPRGDLAARSATGCWRSPNMAGMARP